MTKTTNQTYCVATINGPIWALGDSPETALQRAQDDTRHEDWEIVDVRDACDGDAVIVPCSTALAAQVEEEGGDIGYEILDGEAVTLAEADPYETCPECGAEVKYIDDVPAVDDDDAWAEIQRDHGSDCAWARTRALRMPRTSLGSWR